MAPPPTTGAATHTPLVAKPVASRYRRGKLPNGQTPADLSDSDSDEDDEEQQERQRGPPKRESALSGPSIGPGRVIQLGEAGPSTSRNIQVALRDVKVEDGKVHIGGVGEEEEESSEEEESDNEEEEPDVKPKFISRSSGLSKPPVTAGDQESEYETDSEEEEESEEEPEPPKPVYRPTFVPKRARETVLQREKQMQAEEEAWKKKEEEEKQRKKQSRELLGDTIRREMVEREAGDVIPDVDDTDGLDPQAEFDDWRIRELARLARDKEAALAREEERLEIERRRAMPEEQRLREDEEHARRTREEKPKESRGFLQKYYHKGAFHQDEEILQRNYGAKTESSVDMSMLPKVMQVRDFGKRSRTKYTHLKDQDTTGEGWNRPLKMGPGGQPQQEGCFNCGGPHLRRDCPNNDIRGGSGTGANTSALGAGSLRRNDDRYASERGGHRDRSRSPQRDRRRDHRD